MNGRKVLIERIHKLTIKLALIFPVNSKKRVMDHTLKHEPSDDHVIQLLRELKTRLHYSSMRKVLAVLRLIFSEIRKNLTPQQTALVNSKTPRLLRLVFFSSCNHDIDSGEVKHLDEFVDTLYETDQKTGKGLFRSEIEALRNISIVLISLKGFYTAVGIQILNYSLMREIDEIVQEEAIHNL